MGESPRPQQAQSKRKRIIVRANGYVDPPSTPWVVPVSVPTIATSVMEAAPLSSIPPPPEPIHIVPAVSTAAPKEGVNFNHPCAAHVEILDREKAIVKTTRKKVAIVGYAETSRMLAPFDDPEFEIWGMNQIYRHLPREDRHFDIHHNWEEHVVDGTDHVGWIRDAPIPTYMVHRIAELPNSVTYPIDRAIAIQNKDYFTSSIAFMMALAIMEGFKTIHLYGIDLIVGDEWDYQKPNAEFWIGVASGMGLTVGIPPASALCKQIWRYGYQTEPESLIKISEIVARKQYLSKMRNEKMIEIANLDGALQNVEMFHELAQLRSRGSNVQLK